ncbi:MAG: holo-ACP synthase [Puniceicoccales bacterium]|jgi:holo-[acyl-carrier protein] synthase|nr:holo-ACP synthase [Puniceicoccales bacterium]
MPVEQIALGTDIVETERIREVMRKFGDTFLRKIFSDDEIAYCSKCVDPAVRFAARFAAKEAFSKAVGMGFGKNLRWKDIAVGKKQSGEPQVVLSENAEAAVQKLGFFSIKISISHTKTLAQAIVLLIK